MNRKLRNTILAFSVTGTVLALALITARPLPSEALQPAAIAAMPLAEATDAAATDAAPPGPAALATAPALDQQVEARVNARARQFEDDIAKATSFEGALALTVGFVAAATAEAVVAGLASSEAAPASAGAKSAGEPDTAPRKHRGHVRRAVAVPYFSFARAGHGGRS
ncbi:hypothetical protein [Luteimonas sp. SDU101]|uniref:hypothetical protein n=1 Tax=unclassified Luteimonas TaxID=2629088 RepID=UPI003EBD16F8